MTSAAAWPIAVFLLACFAKVTVIFSGAWAGTTLLRKRQAALRHGIWATAIVAALSIPVLSLVVPDWPSKSLERAVGRWAPAQVARPSAESDLIPGTAISADSANRVPQRWPSILLVVWGSGTLVLLTRLGIDAIRIALLAVRSKPLLDTEWLYETYRISRELGLSASVRLLASSSATAMPVTWGVFEPTILLPASAVEWSDGRRQVVLRHELAHIVRHDSLQQVLAEIARALYWCHPLAWLAADRLRHESECACDDSVLNSGVQPCCYAEQLLELARNLHDRSNHASPVLAMARSTKLERRFMAMLNSRTDRREMSTKFKLLAPLLMLCLSLPLAAVRLPAQNESGKFTGTIYDPSGAAIPNATIIMVDQRADTRDMTTSDSVGNFQFTRLPAGDYEFQVMKPGFKTFAIPSVSLQPGRDLTLNANLELGQVEESVDVTGQRTPKAPGATESVANETTTRLRIGGDVEGAKLFTRVMPVYPESAKRAGAQGIVVLHAVVAKDGSLLSLRVMNGQVNPDLARAAVEAVSHWRYRPTLLNGQPVEIETTIEVNFSLRP